MTTAQSTPASDGPSIGGDQAGSADKLRKFWKGAIDLSASDVLIRPDVPVKYRIRGVLKNANAEAFTVDGLHDEIKAMLTEAQWHSFVTKGSADLAYAYDEENRFRVNVFRTMGRAAIAARRISSDILGYEALNLPPSMEAIAEYHQGLVLLCGVTGSGKSTTIAAMIQQINETRPCHILTIEDPVEYMFRDAKAMVNQREVGIDVFDFSTAIRAMVRENPDVVLIGELRDRETFEAAVQAAETGHLVFGTIHASGAANTFSRVYNLFPAEERELIREMFATTMKAIVYQKLLKTLKPEFPRVPAVEVLLNTPVVTKYILEGREVEIPDLIRKSAHEGMIDFTDWLVHLVNTEFIHPSVGLEAARNTDEYKMRLKGIKTR